MGSPKIINTFAEFIEWTQEVGGRDVLYRGLASDASDYKLSASLHRRMAGSEEKPIQQSQFARAAQELVNQAKMEGHDREIGEQATDLEILARLQHYGAATCLIDFTKNPLVALWFACQPLDNNENGKIVAIDTADADKYDEIGPRNIKTPIKKLMDDEKLWKWQPKKQNNRIVAQQSVFIFGTPEIADDNITSSCVISNKKIRANLEIQGISAESLFCDFDGFAREINGHGSPYRGWTVEDYFDFGIHYQQRGEFKKAIDSYDQAIKINPKYVEAFNNRGSAKGNLGEYRDAIADFNETIEINPKDANTYYNRGITKAILGEHRDAIADFNEAIKINPTYALAFNNRGIAKAALDEHRDAIADYNEAIKINPAYALAFNNRGNARLNLGEHRDAIADFNEAIKINPTHADMYYNRGNARFNLGEYRDAIADFNEVIKINPKDALAFNNRGSTKGVLCEYHDAIADFNEAIKINPKYAITFNNRGKVKLRLGDKEGAMKDFQEAHKIDPDMKIPDMQ